MTSYSSTAGGTSNITSQVRREFNGLGQLLEEWQSHDDGVAVNTSTPPMVNLLVLRSPDIHRAAHFYRVLGLDFNLEQHGDGPEHYTSTFNGFVFELYPLAGREPTTGARIGFSVDSVDELVLRLQGIGVRVLSKPHDSEWGRRAIVHDLDGHTIELNTPMGRVTESGVACVPAS